METNNTPLENINKANPFSVPENYFENLTNQIMTSLPEKNQDVKSSSGYRLIWKKVSPWVYLAAMITGIAFGLSLFIKQDVQTENELMIAEQENDLKSQEILLASIDNDNAEDLLLSFISEYELYEYLVEKQNQLEEATAAK